MRNFLATIGGMSFIYPFICLIIYILKATTQEQVDFMGQPISNGLSYWLANTLYDYVFNVAWIFVWIVIGVASLFGARRLSYR